MDLPLGSEAQPTRWDSPNYGPHQTIVWKFIKTVNPEKKKKKKKHNNEKKEQ